MLSGRGLVDCSGVVPSIPRGLAGQLAHPCGALRVANVYLQLLQPVVASDFIDIELIIYEIHSSSS